MTFSGFFNYILTLCQLLEVVSWFTNDHCSPKGAGECLKVTCQEYSTVHQVQKLKFQIFCSKSRKIVIRFMIAGENSTMDSTEDPWTVFNEITPVSQNRYTLFH